MSYKQFECANEIQLFDKTTLISTPPWIDFLIAMGGWSRRNQQKSRRIISLILVPSRTLAAGFCALGSLLEGARTFEDSLTWPSFRTLPVGTTVHWKQKQGRSNFSGKILGFEDIFGTEFISLEVTKPASVARKGLNQKFSKNHFDEYLFTTEQPANTSKVLAMDDANKILTSWIGHLNPKWIWSDGAESLIVTSMSGFEKDLSDIYLTCNDLLPIPLLNILCFEKNNVDSHSKLRISHPKGELEGEFPLVILDGPEAFHRFIYSSNSSNLLIILERSEYLDDIHNTVLQLRSNGEECLELLDIGLPVIIPSGIELIAYSIER